MPGAWCAEAKKGAQGSQMHGGTHDVMRCGRRRAGCVRGAALVEFFMSPVVLYYKITMAKTEKVAASACDPGARSRV